MLRPMKRAIRPFIPEAIHRLWRRRQFLREQKEASGKPLAQVFEEIYETDGWATAQGARRYSSGPGSEPDVSRAYEDFVVAWIASDPSVATLVDVGCGDFQVAERILSRLSRPVRYVGCDIAANVVAWNSAHYARDGVSFRQLDVTREAPPAGDLVTIREVFQHLSNAAILAALDNLRGRFPRALVTEAVPAVLTRPNVDLVSGYRTRDGHGSAVCLDLPPFGCKVLASHDLAHRGGGVLRTMVVEF